MPLRALAGLLPALFPVAALVAQEPELAVYPEGETCSDARLTRAARTTDTPVRFEPPASAEAWRARAEELRLRVRVAAGIFPAPERDVRLETHGLVDRGDYTVERAWFESHPGHFVTGSLYRPKGGPERKPGVLCAHGHWTNGRLMERSDEEARALIEHGDERSLSAAKYPLQARCVELARLGCVVLHYDMIGYGDNRQFDHNASFGAVEDALRLQSLFGFQTWNSLCALDALCALPDVDPERVGVTGASGGGTQTFVLTAIDERVKVALPAVMVSEHFQGGCRCENGPHLRIGTGNVELTALAAPRPLALTGANDWTRNLETEILPPLKRLYALLDAEELVTGRCWPEFEHNYNVHARELMYEWFSEHLGLRTETPIVERDFEPLTPAELSVFDAEHPALPERALPAAEIQAAFARACDGALETLQVEDPTGYQRLVVAALGVLLDTQLPAPEEVVTARRLEPPDEPENFFEPLALARLESDEEVPVVVIWPLFHGEPSSVVVLVSDGGIEPSLREDAAGLASAMGLLTAGAAVVVVEPLLVGEHGGELDRLPVDEGRHATYHGFTHAFNRTLLAERVHDILTAVAFARRNFPGLAVNLVGAGRAGAWVVLARALAGEAVERTAVDWRSDFDQVARFDDPDFLPGGQRYGGLAGFAAAVAPGELWLVGGEDPPEPGAILARAYRALSKPEHLHLAPADDAARVLQRIAGRE